VELALAAAYVAVFVLSAAARILSRAAADVDAVRGARHFLGTGNGVRTVRDR
jgi:hypothetical protein